MVIQAMPRGVRSPAEPKEAPRLGARSRSSGGSRWVVVTGASVGSQLLFVRRVAFDGGHWAVVAVVVDAHRRTRPGPDATRRTTRIDSEPRRQQPPLNATRRTNESGLPTEAPLSAYPGHCQNHAAFRVYPVLLHHPDTGHHLKRLLGICQGTLSRLDKSPTTVTTIKYRGDAEAQSVRTSQAEDSNRTPHTNTVTQATTSSLHVVTPQSRLSSATAATTRGQGWTGEIESGTSGWTSPCRRAGARAGCHRSSAAVAAR